MTTDPFTEAARTEATSRARRVTPGDTAADWSERMLMMEQFRQGAEWARTHLAAQEPTDAPLTDAEWREFQSIPEQGYSHRAWVDQKIAERLSAARAARRDEEKR